jgi:hypothetical protein
MSEFLSEHLGSGSALPREVLTQLAVSCSHTSTQRSILSTTSITKRTVFLFQNLIRGMSRLYQDEAGRA